MVKIAISGKKRSGKNTLTMELMKSLGICRSFAFADPIKNIALRMFPQIPREYLFGNSELRESLVPETDFSCRHLIRKIGRFGRELDQEIWIKSLFDDIETYLLGGDQPVIISDLRYKNEYDYLKNKGYMVVRINRKTPDVEDQHPSETDLDNLPTDGFDYVFVNDADLEKFKIAAKEILVKICR